MNEATTVDSPKTVKIDFGSGKYRAYKRSVFELFLFVFRNDEAQAFWLVDCLGKELGKLSLNVSSFDDVKFGKASRENLCAIAESSKTDKEVVNSPAIQIARLLNDLEKVRRVGKTSLVVRQENTEGEYLPVFDGIRLSDMLENWLAKALPIDDAPVALSDDE
jgi:hypothetical protein